MNFDVIVLGSGIGGLTCASRLSNLGFKVGVFEKHYIPGGYATNFKRRGYNFDVSLHGIGALDEGGNTHNILNHCGVLNKITPIKNDIAYSVSYKGKLIDIPNDLSLYKALLFELFPNEIKNIKRLFKDINKFNRGFEKFILDKNSSILKKINTDCLKFIKWSEKTTDEVVRSYIDNDDFVYIFTSLWPYYGLPPKQLSALYYFIPWISYHMYGKYYIKGGSQKLSDSMVEVITENGGSVNLMSEVASINFEDNEAKSITLKNGEVFTAKYIVSNINPIDTFNMAKNYTIPLKYKNKISSPTIGCSLSQLYIGLDCNPKELNIPMEEAFYFDSSTPEEDYELSIKANYKECGILLTNYSSMDESLNEYSKGVITVTLIDNYAHWSKDRSEYSIQKENLTNILINRLEEKFPGIKSHIKVTELGTPRTMERYTNNPNGAVYGYSQTIKQAGRYRLSTNTPIHNLFLVGAWVNPGGGYEGSISSGMMVAQNIFNKLK